MSAKRDDAIRQISFSKLDLNDPFFESLRQSYNGFDKWMKKKSASGECAWVSFEADKSISSMLYLKSESDTDTACSPVLTGKRLKIGTFKVDFDHHTSIGNRLLAIALRQFAQGDYEYAYVTMYDAPNTRPLKQRLEKYGFKQTGSKGNEEVWEKQRANRMQTDPYAAFPFVMENQGSDYLLAIFPKYHVKMFGDTTLQSEYDVPVKDMVSINTIEKIYLSASPNAEELQLGDHIIPYRTKDDQGSALHRSVVSGVCTVTGVKKIQEFKDEDEFKDFIHRRSVFSDQELHNFWEKRRYPYIISFLYNAPFERYPNRDMLLKRGIIKESDRIVCEPIDKQLFKQIIAMGNVDEGYLIH